MNKEDVGKFFTTNGGDKWKMIWLAMPGELSESGHTHHMLNLGTGEEESFYCMKNQESNEELTQLNFYSVANGGT